MALHLSNGEFKLDSCCFFARPYFLLDRFFLDRSNSDSAKPHQTRSPSIRNSSFESTPQAGMTASEAPAAAGDAAVKTVLGEDARGAQGAENKEGVRFPGPFAGAGHEKPLGMGQS